MRFALRSLFLAGLAFWLTPPALAQTSSRSAQKQSAFATEFLTDPALLREEPKVIPRWTAPAVPAAQRVAPEVTPEPNPTPAPTMAKAGEAPAPAARQTVRWRETEDEDGRRLRVAVDGDEVIRTRTGVLQSDAPRDSGQLTARRSRDTAIALTMPTGGGLFVGTEIPVPAEYSPAQVSGGWGAGWTVVPSTPTRFGSRETGIRFDSGGFRSTEFEGFINYGSPIRTIAPVFDAEGRPVGFQVIETPNPVLQPVFRTIEIR